MKFIVLVGALLAQATFSIAAGGCVVLPEPNLSDKLATKLLPKKEVQPVLQPLPVKTASPVQVQKADLVNKLQQLTPDQQQKFAALQNAQKSFKASLQTEADVAQC